MKPVAQIMAEYDGGYEQGRCVAPLIGCEQLPIGTPLYARPAPLSDWQIVALVKEWDRTPGASLADLIRAAERAIWGEP